MVVVNLALWAYAMGVVKSMFAPVVYFCVSIIFMGMMELASQLSDPFGHDDSDFPLFMWLMEVLDDAEVLTEYRNPEELLDMRQGNPRCLHVSLPLGPSEFEGRYTLVERDAEAVFLPEFLRNGDRVLEACDEPARYRARLGVAYCRSADEADAYSRISTQIGDILQGEMDRGWLTTELKFAQAFSGCPVWEKNSEPSAFLYSNEKGQWCIARDNPAEQPVPVEEPLLVLSTSAADSNEIGPVLICKEPHRLGNDVVGRMPHDSSAKNKCVWEHWDGACLVDGNCTVEIRKVLWQEHLSTEVAASFIRHLSSDREAHLRRILELDKHAASSPRGTMSLMLEVSERASSSHTVDTPLMHGMKLDRLPSRPERGRK